MTKPRPKPVRSADLAPAQPPSTWPLRRLPMPALLLDAETRILEASDSWLELAGYTRDQVVGRPVADLLAPQSARHLAAEVVPCLWRKGRVDAVVLLIKARAGGVIQVRATLQAGDDRRILAVMMPEADLRAELEQYAAAPDHWLWEMDADLRFAWISRNAPSSAGLPVEWYCGKTREEIGEPDLDPEAWAAHRAALARREPFTDFTYRLRSPRGPVWIRTSGRPIFGPDGAFLGYRGTAADVTAEIEGRRTAEAAAGRLAMALDAAEDVVALWDADDRLVICNERFREACGLPPDQLRPGVSFEAVIRAVVAAGRLPTARGCEAEWIERRLARHRNPTEPFENPLCDGRWLLIREQRADSGETVLIGTDITSLKRQQETMRQALQTAEEANASRAAFMAQMSHELRTPMNAILGFAEVLESQLHGPLGDARYVEYVAHIHDSGRQLLDLINDLLDISKIEAGAVRIREEPVDLRKLIAEAIELSGPMAERKRVGLQGPQGAAPVRLLADRRAVRQVLMNLLSNAIKFTDVAGAVQVELAVDADGAAVTVADNGRGIPPDQVEAVWQPFAPVEDRLLTRPLLGNGLGLSVVRTLMEMHQGTAGLESEPGVGTRVTVRFPAARLLPQAD